ncbi:MAG: 23S rRNA (guanosine(2251)-2'-O)-methyltransferase RlmB [Parcubacteria group bacterium]|nr:23S rRNA (guanosine(2251)-2'-O)-methyltransferase RlmB [Parcubacteria group bacterium]
MIRSKTYIYGRHALMEALTHAPKTVEQVFLATHIHDDALKGLIRKAGALMSSFPADTPPRGIDAGAVHQGFIALVSTDALVLPYDEFIRTLSVNPDTALVLLDELEDPQNVGAIIRSAAAFGISGVLLPEHNQAQITGSVVKVSAGMAFRIPLVQIGNVNMTVRDLKEKGFWIYGLDEEAPHPIAKEVFDAPAVFILGNESKGIRAKTRELCDVLLSIATNEQCESLNVGASAAVALHQWSLGHPKALHLEAQPPSKKIT